MPQKPGEAERRRLLCKWSRGDGLQTGDVAEAFKDRGISPTLYLSRSRLEIFPLRMLNQKGFGDTSWGTDEAEC